MRTLYSWGNIRRWKYTPRQTKLFKEAYLKSQDLVRENFRLRAEVEGLQQANFQLQNLLEIVQRRKDAPTYVDLHTPGDRNPG